VASQLVVARAVRDTEGLLGDAVLIDGACIAAVGTAERLRRPGLTEREIPGVIVPGLRDAHLHPVGLAVAQSRLSVQGIADLASLARCLREAAAEAAPGTPVIALHFDDEALAERTIPDRHFLDAAVPGIPVLLLRYCGHVAAANTAALEAAGVDPNTPDPPGGWFDRNPQGHPNGVLREQAAALVTRALGRLTPPLTAADLVAAANTLAAVGITGAGAIVSVDQGLWGGNSLELDLVVEAAPCLPFPLRVLVVARSPRELKAAARQLDASGPNATFLGLKMFADGSLGGHTAALREDYSDSPGTRGSYLLDGAWAAKMICAAGDLGGSVAIHAIGDLAVGKVLDVMEEAVRAGADSARLRIEHASVIGTADLFRLADLGVAACVQPAFLASETSWLVTRLGPERLGFTYPFRSLTDAGVPLAGSSDCPVEPPNPLWGMAAARDRCGIVPEQSLTSAEALALFTTGAAQSIGEDARLEPGLPATLTILGVDPVAATPDQLRKAAVLATFVAGRHVAGLDTGKPVA
jgi:predicted amidohydrolase YtcJ